MGYSVYVNAKDKDKQQKMYIFLDKNMKNYCEVILGDINHTGVRLAKGRQSEDGLAYAWGRYPVGFDYQSGTFGMEKFYVTEIAKWISKKIGNGKNYNYDNELLEINDSFSSKSYMDFLENECKFTKIKDLFPRSIDFIKNEIERLDKLWMEQG